MNERDSPFQLVLLQLPALRKLDALLDTDASELEFTHLL